MVHAKPTNITGMNQLLHHMILPSGVDLAVKVGNTIEAAAARLRKDTSQRLDVLKLDGYMHIDTHMYV